VATALVFIAAVGACGGSPAKHVAAGTKAEDTTTTTASADTSTSLSGSVSGGTTGTATVSPGTYPMTTTHPGSVPTNTTVPPTTSTTRGVPAGSTGVRGVVTAGPTCPVQRQGDPSCDDRPVPAHLVLERGDGSTAASGDAGSDGQFFIAAQAGSYALTATSPNAMRCSSQPVTVTSGHVTDVHVSCDTGIR
jgi:hypothetical protein